MKRSITDRNFARIDFEDVNKEPCSIQESSMANEGCFLWLGTNKNRMHLDKKTAKAIVTEIEYWLKNDQLFCSNNFVGNEND